jgi:ethanolamine-phosphate cytidylyltransferase
MVMASRYVDEVIIGSPFKITEDLIKSFNISVIVKGKDYDDMISDLPEELQNPYKVAEEKGIVVELGELESVITHSEITKRLHKNMDKIEAKVIKSNLKQDNYYENKSFVQEL